MNIVVAGSTSLTTAAQIKMLNQNDCCLVVVDVQGKLAQLMHDKETLFKNIRILIQSAKILNIPILWCQQVPAALGDTIPEIAELLTDNQPINKSSFSCCGCEEFNSKLEKLGRQANSPLQVWKPMSAYIKPQLIYWRRVTKWI